jgi:hypothetical protein
MRAEKIRTIDGHLRLFPAFWTAILDLKRGLKVDKLVIANKRIFRVC